MKLKLFEDSIFINYFDNQNFTDQALEVLSNHKKLKYKIKKSNVLGFQTENLNNEFLAKKILDWSIQTLGDNLLFKKNINLRLLNFWINENFKYSYNQVHNHCNSHFSGVFYLQVPKNSGNIFFLRPDFTSTMLDLSDWFYASPLNIEEKEIQNYKNQFILFPSTFMHGVKMNETNHSRITISFNLALHD
tara:strand:- start:3 stop:572 length:570 start_codon:yes stop_codon:yes gene_type:complete